MNENEKVKRKEERKEKKKKIAHKICFMSSKFNLLAFCLFLLSYFEKKEEKKKRKTMKMGNGKEMEIALYCSSLFFIKC